MNEQDVLHHLLQVEADAAALVDEAQVEADKRILESEKLNRAAYEEQYNRKIAELEATYEKEIAAIKDDHKEQLNAYRQSLDALTIQTDSFSNLVKSLLLKSA
ncbi:MAG: hypothetical protein LBG73_03640 [Spirochaetaceae bacterium]|jgi:vacuolar-type H+-ATPase subunit H|nr:hypothetical protein [Spirochaetaceae bacterium]